jgi:predicted O-methyltransferase YrrM
MAINTYTFRNLFKENLCRVHDTLEYARQHPYSRLRQEAHASTGEFVRERLRRAVPCRSPRKLLDLALSRIKLQGHVVEFGVFRGASLRHIARQLPNQTAHGFDSFEGLSEDWLHNARSAFSTGGKVPKVPANVRLHKGYFEATLPTWVEQNPGAISFAHIDCDLGSSTATIFKLIADRVQPGTVLLFDDYFNFPYWQEDGHAVLEQVGRERHWQLSYIGYGYKELAVRVD